MRGNLLRRWAIACALATSCWLALAAHGGGVSAGMAPEGDRFAQLPDTWRQPWQEAERQATATRMALDTAMGRARDAIEAQVFDRLAAELSLPSLDGIALNYVSGGVVRRDSLKDYIRSGRFYEFWRSGYMYRKQYERQWKLLSPDGRQVPGLTVWQVFNLLKDRDPASLVETAIGERMNAGDWQHRKPVVDAALAELRFAQLEAVRRGGISTEQHIRLASALADDRGGSDGDLSWAVHTVRVGRDWLQGDLASPLRLPVFSLNVRAAHGQPDMRFLYVPGHPNGSLRYVPEGARPSAMVTDGGKFPLDVLVWLDTRMARPDFLALLTGMNRLGWTDASLPVIPVTGRPMRFEDAVVAMHVNKVRSGIDPHFMRDTDPATSALALRTWAVISDRAAY